MVVFLREVVLEDFDSFGKIDDFIWIIIIMEVRDIIGWKYYNVCNI